MNNHIHFDSDGEAKEEEEHSAASDEEDYRSLVQSIWLHIMAAIVEYSLKIFPRKYAIH